MRDIKLLSIDFKFVLKKNISSDLIRILTSGYKKIGDGTYLKDEVTLNLCENQIIASSVEYKQLKKLSKKINEKLSEYNPEIFYDVNYNIFYDYQSFDMINSLFKPNFIQEQPYAITNISFASTYNNLLFLADIRLESKDIIFIKFNSLLKSFDDLDNEELDVTYKNYIIEYLDKTIEERFANECNKK